MAIAPTVETVAASSITAFQALSGGHITAYGDSDTSVGVCWGLAANPTISDDSTYNEAANANNIYRSSLTELLPNTTYHYRAYATNAAGTGYGADLTFTTPQVYTTTINFPIQNINDTETIQLQIIFTHLSSTYGNRTWNAEDHGMLVTDWGKIRMSYYPDMPLMAVSNINIEIGDANGELDNLLYGIDPFNITVIKTAEANILLNDLTYGGNIVDTTVDSNRGNRRISFEVCPRTNKLNEKMVYRDTNVPLNPLHFDLTLRYPLSLILEKIYQIASPTINYADSSLEIIHDWTFQGQRYYGGVSSWLSDIKAFEIEILVKSLFRDNYLGISSLGDVLKNLAIDFGAFTGMFGKNKAFFKKLFHFDPENIQIVKVLQWEKTYTYNLIDFVSYICNFIDEGGGLQGDPNSPYEQGIYTALADRFINKTGFLTFWKVGTAISDTYTNCYFGRVDTGHFTGTDYFIFDHGSALTFPDDGDIFTDSVNNYQVVGLPIGDTQYLVTKRVSGTGTPSSSGTLTRVGGIGMVITYTSFNTDAVGYYNIFQGRDPAIESNAFQNYGDLVSKFWFKYRGNMQNCRVDKFTLLGCNYDFLKDFVYGTSKYQIISLTLNIAESNSECEAIYMGETTS